MLHEFELKLSAFNVGPDANNRAGVIAPAPSSAEVLRQIAADVKGDFAFALAGILTRAADELEANKARLQFLIDNEAHVCEIRGYYQVFRTAWGDSEELTPYSREGWTSAETAIDAARTAGK